MALELHVVAKCEQLEHRLDRLPNRSQSFIKKQDYETGKELTGPFFAGGAADGFCGPPPKKLRMSGGIFCFS
jgi:hypothetical protein